MTWPNALAAIKIMQNVCTPLQQKRKNARET